MTIKQEIEEKTIKRVRRIILKKKINFKSESLIDVNDLKNFKRELLHEIDALLYQK